MISAVCGPWVGWEQSEITLQEHCIVLLLAKTEFDDDRTEIHQR